MESWVRADLCKRPERAVAQSSDGPIVRIAQLEIDPEAVESYKALLCEEIDASVRFEPGVLFLYAMSIKGSPNKVRVVEGYADQASYDAHLTTPHFLSYKTRTAGMVRSLELIETDPIMLKAKGDRTSN
jgi:quinol monooxygenase YgiN